MKKIIYLSLIIGLMNYLKADAQVKSCCSMNATTEFAMLGKDANFEAAHLSPIPFNFVSTTGKDVTFPSADGKEVKAYMVKSENTSDHYLFVFHEWWGLNDYIKKETERIAGELPGVNVIALDMYDGQIATTPDVATKLMQSMTKERGEAIITAAQQYIGKDAEIQTIGWCFGGGWSMQAALLLGKQAKGCVIYYGMPEKDEERLKHLNAPVLGIFASQDNWITKDVVNAFEKQMKELKKPITINFYDADHAFANPSNPKYNKPFAEEAHTKAIAFIKKNF